MYETDKILEMLRDLFDRKNSTATQTVKDDVYICCPETIINRFGSMAKARILAGVPDNTTEGQILREILSKEKELGRKPRVEELKISEELIKQRFDSYDKAYQYATREVC